MTPKLRNRPQSNFIDKNQVRITFQLKINFVAFSAEKLSSSDFLIHNLSLGDFPIQKQTLSDFLAKNGVRLTFQCKNRVRITFSLNNRFQRRNPVPNNSSIHVKFE